jgi:hypothetical protein
MVVSSVGCSQSGIGALNSPTAPSSLSTGPSVWSESGEFTTLAGPGDSCDIDDTRWRFVVYNGPNTNAPLDGDFETVFHQDGDGNITFVDDDDNTITLTRLGTGVITTYRISLLVDSSPCDFEVSGVVKIDTRTNTGDAHVRITADDCGTGVQYVTLAMI